MRGVTLANTPRGRNAPDTFRSAAGTDCSVSAAAQKNDPGENDFFNQFP
jgi:hypothetical protein